MTTQVPMRDSVKDQLLTAKNAALIIIDFQPTQVHSVASRDKRELVANITAVARLAKLFDLPVVISTVNVASGVNGPTIHQITEVFPDLAAIDRTAINAWEDQDFVRAVKATGRRKLVIAALWTEVCLAFPSLDALADGYEVYPVVDAVGGTSVEAHEAGLRRIEQAGAKPICWVSLACELQRDWNRTQTAKAFAQIVFAVEGN
jgi:nicotinamidase-related amidase